jgi:hypothetical protein
MEYYFNYVLSVGKKIQNNMKKYMVYASPLKFTCTVMCIYQINNSYSHLFKSVEGYTYTLVVLTLIVSGMNALSFSLTVLTHIF